MQLQSMWAQRVENPGLALSGLEDVAPLRLLLAFGIHKRAERHDLDAVGARVADEPQEQGAPHTTAAESIRDSGMVGDDQLVAGAAECQLSFRVDPIDSRNI